jgi:hypothetical protein
MGTTLYNKIYLGRHSVLHSRRFQTAVAIGTVVTIGLVWVALRNVK